MTEEQTSWAPPKPEKKVKLPICFDCKYHEPIEGTAQSSCNLPKGTHVVVVAWKKAIDNGTFRWPLNYDSTQLVECDGGFSKKETN
jgi:hypothetical protein